MTNYPVDSIFHPHVPGEVPDGNATNVNSTEAAQPSTTPPATDPLKLVDETSNKAATADDSKEAVQPSSSSTPATKPVRLVDQASSKAATADDSTEAVQPFPPTASDGLIEAPSRTAIPATEIAPDPNIQE